MNNMTKDRFQELQQSLSQYLDDLSVFYATRWDDVYYRIVCIMGENNYSASTYGYHLNMSIFW